MHLALRLTQLALPHIPDSGHDYRVPLDRPRCGRARSCNHRLDNGLISNPPCDMHGASEFLESLHGDDSLILCNTNTRSHRVLRHLAVEAVPNSHLACAPESVHPQYRVN